MDNLSLGFDEQQLPDILPVGSPSDGLPPEAPSLGLTDVTAGIGDTSALPVAQPRSLGLGTTGGMSGRPQSDQDYLRSLSAGEKIGLMMQEFSAGVAGRASPIDTLLKQKREKEMRGMQELTNTITVLQKGSEILRKLPQGSLQRAAIAEQLGKAVGPRFAPVFAAAGSEQDDAIKNYLDVMGDPEVKQMAVKQCAQSSDFQGCVLKLSLDDSWGKKAETVVDAKRMPALTTKMRAVAESMKTSGKETFALADIEAANQGNALFSFEEMQTLKRNESMFAPFGLKTKEVQKAGDIAREQAAVKALNESKLPVEKLIEARDRMKAANPDNPNIRILDQAITHAVDPQSQKIIIPPQPRNLQLTTDEKGNQLIVNPDGTTRPLTREEGGGVRKAVAADKPMTEFQGKAALYGTRSAQSDKVLKSLEDKISTTGLAAGQATGVVGNALMSSDQRRVDQAQRDFVNAVLRQESGAVISDAEFANAKKQYFPQPGDDPKVVAQKRANRDLAIKGFARMSGPKGAADIQSVIDEPLLPGVSAINPTPGQRGVSGAVNILDQADAILKRKR